jgi:hypothetical protein
MSSIGVYALLAAAADSAMRVEEVVSLDAAYFRSICTLNTLLDSVLDLRADGLTGNFSSFGQARKRHGGRRAAPMDRVSGYDGRAHAA